MGGSVRNGETTLRARVLRAARDAGLLDRDLASHLRSHSNPGESACQWPRVDKVRTAWHNGKMEWPTSPVLVCLILVLVVAVPGCGVAEGLIPSLTAVPMVSVGTAQPGPSEGETAEGPRSSPSPVPSPTLASTPTPSALAGLDAARAALSIGDYTAAVAEYSSVLELGAAADAVADAKLELGIARLAAREYGAAAATLIQFLQNYADDERAQEAHFYLAETLLADGQPLAAADEYRLYLASGTVITAYVGEWLGIALHAGGSYDAATEAYEESISNAPDRLFLLGVRERLALTRVAVGDYDGALEQYDAILAIAEDRSYRARIEYQAAQTLLLAGAGGNAYDRFLTIVETYPREQYAYLALVELVEVGLPPDDYLRGIVDYYGGAYGPAVQAFERYIADYPDSFSGEALWYAGLSYLSAGSPELAAIQFQELITGFPGTPRYGDAWMGLATAHADAGDVDMAVATYQAFVGSEPDHPRAPEALWRAGVLLERSGDLQTSAQAYADCHIAYPDSDYGPAALFHSALQYYRLGRLIPAAVAWDTLAEGYSDSDYHAAALFWLGKVRLRQGDADSASELLREAHRVDPVGWYGLRAADLLDDALAVPFPEYLARPEQLSEGELELAEEWLGGWLNLDVGSDPGEWSDQLSASAGLRRGLELWRIGRRKEAKVELEALRNAAAADPLVQYQLALLFQDIGLYRSSILCAIRLMNLSPATSVLDVPEFIARLAYPVYYEDLLVQSADAQGLPPLLVFALVRQESLFESMAFSSANAHGLMQVIPSTGAQIATELAWPPEYEKGDLYLPTVSVRFGTYYLAKQRDLFDGRLEIALAAYNGGPGNASVWLETAAQAEDVDGRSDPDLFVEMITLSESRQYVQLVKSHWAIYRLLYS